MEDLEELYVNMNFIFNNEKMLNRSIQENLFELDYIKVYVLVLSYLNLCTVPKNVLQICINGELPKKQYEEIYNFLADKWEEKAKEEIEEIVYAFENGEDIE